MVRRHRERPARARRADRRPGVGLLSVAAEDAAFAATLRSRLESEGPIPIDRYMAAVNRHYYATRDPFGRDGDFVTAPEISQMFGEIVGLALADLWQRAGRPRARYVELGPGRGTLAADALRAMRVAGLAPPVDLVETSPTLRAAQAARLPHAAWHDDADDLPGDAALMIVANEFLDALPVRQYLRTVTGWREREVAALAGALAPAPGAAARDAEVPAALRHADPGSVWECCPQAQALVEGLSRRLARQGGVLLAFDYGHAGRAAGDTLQAVHAHAYADPFARPGTSDLSAHVDFGALAAAAGRAGGRAHGPVAQGQWLIALGLSDRAAALARAAPAQSERIAAAYQRLTAPEAMGDLFKAFAVTGGGWPAPAGFA